MLTECPTTIIEYLRANAEQNPQSPAIMGLGRIPLTHEGLYAQAQDTLHALNGMGLGRSDRVAVVVPTSVESVVSIITVQACMACVPMNPASSLTEIFELITRLKVKAVIIAEGIDTAAWQAAEQLGLLIITLTPLSTRQRDCFASARPAPTLRPFRQTVTGRVCPTG